MNQERKQEAAGGARRSGTGRHASVVTCFLTKFERGIGVQETEAVKGAVRRTPCDTGPFSTRRIRGWRAVSGGYSVGRGSQ